jgi:protein phosphatase
MRATETETGEVMTYYAISHKGNVRHNNEDACYAPENSEHGFFMIVADGMGGHNAGEIASGIVVDTFREMLNGMQPETVTEDTLRAAMNEANARVLSDAQKHPGRSGMGSTATAAVFRGNEALIAHVGDSRAYLYHDNCLRQITRDHSYVQMLLDLGYINEQQAAGHPQKNIITRAVGTDAEVITDIYRVALAEGDCLLLCSDGLNVMVSNERIAAILEEGYAAAAERLVEAALDAGGVDNISVVIAVKDGGCA